MTKWLPDRRTGRFTRIGLLAVTFGALIACTPSHPQSTFDALGPVAESQLVLFWWIFWAGAAVFVAVEGALIYAAVKFRRRSDTESASQNHGNTKLEIVWTVVPIILLAILVVPTIQTIFYNMNSPKTAAQGGLVVDAVGHQWWFEFRYRNPLAPDEQIVTANELHIPVGEPVNIRLDSVDVIHSFWVPKLAGKVDMVPNNGNTMWIQADHPGEYYGQCAEFCGISHAHMKFKVIAEPWEEFDRWLKHQASPAVDFDIPQVQAGKQLFKEKGCSGCHATNSIIKLRPDGTMARGRKGPVLTHVASRRHLAAGIMDNTDQNGSVNDALLQGNLTRWLSDPERVKPGNIMARQAIMYIEPEKNLSENEISTLVAYLTTLK